MDHRVDLSEVEKSVARRGMLKACVASAIHRMGGRPTGERIFEVELVLDAGHSVTSERLQVVWEASKLESLCPTLVEDLEDLSRGSTPLLEKATEFGAYALAFCTVNAFMPGRVVTHMNCGSAPDLWLSLGEDAGIEVAGRTSGRAWLRKMARNKRIALRVRADLKEAHMSLWVFEPPLGRQERVL